MGSGTAVAWSSQMRAIVHAAVSLTRICASPLSAPSSTGSATATGPSSVSGLGPSRIWHADAAHDRTVMVRDHTTFHDAPSSLSH